MNGNEQHVKCRRIPISVALPEINCLVTLLVSRSQLLMNYEVSVVQFSIIRSQKGYTKIIKKIQSH